MTEQPRTFTAPVTGRYHVTSGSEPHLAEDCTDACRVWDGRFVAEPGEYRSVELNVITGSTVGLMNSGAAVEMPMDTVAIAFDHD